MPSRFPLYMRGYNPHDVDELAAVVDQALSSSDGRVRAAALDRLRSCQFRLRMRGYSRLHVDQYVVNQIAALSGPR